MITKNTVSMNLCRFLAALLVVFSSSCAFSHLQEIRIAVPQGHGLDNLCISNSGPLIFHPNERQGAQYLIRVPDEYSEFISCNSSGYDGSTRFEVTLNNLHASEWPDSDVSKIALFGDMEVFDRERRGVCAKESKLSGASDFFKVVMFSLDSFRPPEDDVDINAQAEVAFARFIENIVKIIEEKCG